MPHLDEIVAGDGYFLRTSLKFKIKDLVFINRSWNFCQIVTLDENGIEMLKFAK
jgi:hypothetical protein